jgi:hypothetical protein
MMRSQQLSAWVVRASERPVAIGQEAGIFNYIYPCILASFYCNLSCKISGSPSPDVQSRTSRASSPDELTPTLCSDRCYMGAASHPGESPSLMDASTQYSTATAGTVNTLVS